MKLIHYPVFLACRDCTDNLFWKQIFEGLAYKEPPKGIYFGDGEIYSVTKKKEFKYSFGDKTPETIYADIYNLLHNTYGLKSRDDQTKGKEIFDDFRKRNSARKAEDVWGKIKKKSLKENLIQDYVLECQRKYNLPLKETQKLYFYISVGLVFKLFQTTDIHMSGGFIKRVEGIDMESSEGIEGGEGRVYITRQFKEPVIKKQSRKSAYLRELWLAYIKSLK